uniref:Uncharacterized protein n=1 Tax=Oxyrrhis marina TaxID=2969 RepID=A0A7S4GN00_OXYMA
MPGDVAQHGVGFSLLDRVRQRFLKDMIAGATEGNEGRGRYVAMVLDEGTVKILSSCLRVYDLLEEGVTVVETIEKPRQSLPSLDALYFLTPTMTSVRNLQKDFKDPKRPQYGNIHIFFSSEVPEQLVRQLAQDPNVVCRVKTLKDMNLNFIMHDSACFHCGRDRDIVDLFPGPIPQPAVDDIVSRLVCLCVSMKQQPLIRFLKSGNDHCERVARELDTRLRDIFQKLGDSDKPAEKAQIFSRDRAEPTGVLLILDRSFDPAAPLVHDFGYEALAYDVLDGRKDGCPFVEVGQLKPKENTFEYTFRDARGGENKKSMILGDKDEVWQRYKHEFLGSATKKLNKEIQEFSSENAMAKFQKGARSSDTAATKDAIRQLPEYQEKMSRYSGHTEMTSACFKALDARGSILQKICELEQDLACGVDKEGNEVTNARLIGQLSQYLYHQREAVSSEELVRLLLLYMSMVDDAYDKILDRDHHLSEIDKNKIRRMLQTKVHLPPSRQGAFCATQDGARGEPARGRLRAERVKEFQSAAREKDSVALYRFSPLLGNLVKKLVSRDGLPGDQFGQVPDKLIFKKDRFKADRDRLKQPTVIAFVVGGVTLSEIRTVTQAARSEDLADVNVVVGGSCILTPKRLLDVLHPGAPEGA